MECVVNEEVKALAVELDKLVKMIMDNPAAYEVQRKRALYAGIKFKRDECQGMDKTFRKEFEAAGRVARIIKRENDDGRTFTYTIRYRSNAFKAEASSTDLWEAKRLFIAATNAEGVRI